MRRSAVVGTATGHLYSVEVVVWGTHRVKFHDVVDVSKLRAEVGVGTAKLHVGQLDLVRVSLQDLGDWEEATHDPTNEGNVPVAKCRMLCANDDQLGVGGARVGGDAHLRNPPHIVSRTETP